MIGDYAKIFCHIWNNAYICGLKFFSLLLNINFSEK